MEIIVDLISFGILRTVLLSTILLQGNNFGNEQYDFHTKEKLDIEIYSINIVLSLIHFAIALLSNTLNLTHFYLRNCHPNMSSQKIS